jgi:hypothetical protein
LKSINLPKGWSFPGRRTVTLDGLVVSVLATGPNVRGYIPGRRRWIFNGDKMRSTKHLEGPCRMILRNVTEPYRNENT